MGPITVSSRKVTLFGIVLPFRIVSGSTSFPLFLNSKSIGDSLTTNCSIFFPVGSAAIISIALPSLMYIPENCYWHQKYIRQSIIIKISDANTRAYVGIRVSDEVYQIVFCNNMALLHE